MNKDEWHGCWEKNQQSFLHEDDMLNGWLRPDQAAAYASISRRTLYCWFKQGLKYSKIGQVRLIRKTDLDGFLEQFSTTEQAADQLVDEILKDVMP